MAHRTISSGGRLALWLMLLLPIEAAISPSPFAATDFIDCNDPCNGGDVNYELTSRVRTIDNFMGGLKYKGRMYDNPENPNSVMGPTMRVRPGQSMWIKFRNNLTEPSLGPNNVKVYDYWEKLQEPGEFIKYEYYKEPVDTPEEMEVDYFNMPKNFDNTNLHLHGLDIEVHMFDPVDTNNPNAPHISIKPNECYCYKFQVPDHHPTGMYWYHPHLHGSTALQIWGGMLGLLYVEGGPLEKELHDYGIVQQEEFVIWDPAFQQVEGKAHDIEVDEFLMGQTTLSKIHPFLVNEQTNPVFTTKKGQVVWFHALCGTIENENTFIVYKEGEENQDWNEVSIPFFIIAADGVTWSSATKRNILVMAGGQRYEILIQLDEPGRYVISQQGIQGMQFFDMYGHPHDQVLATIVVEDEEGIRPTVPIEDMVFTPGYKPEEDIQAKDIVKTETIVFSMGANRNQAPFPQYYVNGKPFAPGRIDFTAHPGEAREYILVNANHNVHPFHIHVNRFQVKEMGSELSTEVYPVLKSVLDFSEEKAWRDTVIVPPNGRTRIWVQYKNYTGKTVLHCHFLAHEDTGMMSTLFIGEQDFVFDWREHQKLLIGAVFGLILAGVFGWCSSSATKRKDMYAAVALNELKSKAQD